MNKKWKSRLTRWADLGVEGFADGVLALIATEAMIWIVGIEAETIERLILWAVFMTYLGKRSQ